MLNPMPLILNPRSVLHVTHSEYKCFKNYKALWKFVRSVYSHGQLLAVLTAHCFTFHHRQQPKDKHSWN